MAPKRSFSDTVASKVARMKTNGTFSSTSAIDIALQGILNCETKEEARELARVALAISSEESQAERWSTATGLDCRYITNLFTKIIDAEQLSFQKGHFLSLVFLDVVLHLRLGLPFEVTSALSWSGLSASRLHC